MVTMERGLRGPRLLCQADTQKDVGDMTSIEMLVAVASISEEEPACSSREDHSRMRRHRRPEGLVRWHAALVRQGLGDATDDHGLRRPWREGACSCQGREVLCASGDGLMMARRARDAETT